MAPSAGMESSVQPTKTFVTISRMLRQVSCPSWTTFTATSSTDKVKRKGLASQLVQITFLIASLHHVCTDMNLMFPKGMYLVAAGFIRPANLVQPFDHMYLPHICPCLPLFVIPYLGSSIVKLRSRHFEHANLTPGLNHVSSMPDTSRNPNEDNLRFSKSVSI